MTTTGAVHGADTADLQRRVEALLEALDVAGSRVPGAVAARVRRTAAQVRERLELGVDQTVVALAGGTGSGKSSLFNAIAGLEFAEVGVKRPTTSRVTACVWGADGEPLLDWLGVGPDDRIQRESELDADDQAPLRGLVLLDLPDHDSVSPEHRQVVDRVVPLADLLVWVVDPQKYADDALHTGYLQRLVGHQASMVVVLNQLDTLAPEVRGELADDLRRLLVEDGLPGVGVLRASARTGEGIDTVRAELAGVVGQRSSAALRAGTEVDDAARELGGRLGAAEPAPARLAVTPVVDALTDAVGLPAVSDAVGAVVRGGSGGVPELGAVPADAVGLVRSSWLDTATDGLPRAWGLDVTRRVAGVDELRDALTAALARVTLAARPSRGAAALVVLAGVLGVLALALGGLATGLRLGGGALSWALVGGAVGAVVAALVALWSAAGLRARAGRRRAATVTADGRAAVEAVAVSGLVEPTQEVMAEHRRARELVAAARTAATRA
ncbi:MAG: ABC transporter [Cellulomonas sp. 73-92]|uniref:GTPase n=1 Tax=Cellulomonas sp. 73-92 TaxID=1895740 RepID=UPI00092B906E|nr:GTPase [Cellulomonas sp. 73-92]OJV78840.1 MAG: ABC transporter [Cellulomonas sp. 73-92]